MKLIGLDVGTTGSKAIVFDSEGHIVSQGFREYGIIGDAPGAAEQDAEQVWSLAKEALREAVAKAGKEDVAALSLSVQGDAIIPVDGDYQALHHAILGMDYRSGPQAKRCADTLGALALFEETGMRPHPMTSLSKVLLLRELAPTAFSKAARIVTYADFMLGKLGGEAAIDFTMASRTMAFELKGLRWSERIHRALDLDPAIWSKPAPSGSVIGTIRRALAEELGLPSNLALVTGGHDQTCAALGAGALGPGLGVVSTGTAEVLSTSLDAPVLSKAMFGSFYPCYPHAAKGMFFTFSLNHVGGILLRWWRDNFAGQEVAEASRRGIEAYQVIDERLPEGPSPLMVLPHFNGSGTPACDLQSKGAVLGLTLASTRHDLAKAILEGLAFELNLNLETMLACGLPIKELVAVGGGAKSAVWLQMKADVLNRPLRTPRCREAACLGAALLAGTAVGVYKSLDEAVAQTVRYEQEYVPSTVLVPAYSERYATYKLLHPSVRGIHARL